MLSPLLILLAPYSGSAQKDKKTDCLGATLMELPLKQLKGKSQVVEKEYNKEDNYTFWYQLETERRDTLTFTISSTHKKDIYDFSLYRYDGDDFCQEVVYGGLDPRSIGSLSNAEAPPGTKGYEPVTYKDLIIEPGQTYFISVMNVGGKGCGHIARFKSGNEHLTVHAKASDCFKVPQKELAHKKEEGEESKEETNGSKEKKKDRPSGNIKTAKVQVLLLDSSRKTNIPGQLRVMNKKSGKKEFLELSGDSIVTLELKKGIHYSFRGKSIGYHTRKRSLNLDSSFMRVELLLPRLRKGENIVLQNIYFHPNTYALREQSKDEITKLFQFLKNSKDVKIEIQGHTASDRSIQKVNPLYRDKGPAWNFTGTAEELSILRAKAVKKRLMQKGVEEERLKTEGFGAKRKLVENPRDRYEARRNMRVEILILE